MGLAPRYGMSLSFLPFWVAGWRAGGSGNSVATREIGMWHKSKRGVVRKRVGTV